jgi:Flp pilus assembly protein TadD
LLLALAVAVVWTVHPLLTESVTAVVNRAEALAGLFYLLTLYGFIRGAAAPSPRGWRTLSGGACLLGMATKEWMVSAPLIVLLYDRTFMAGTFRAAWRGRRGYYLGLAGTWALLALLMFGSHHRNEAVGFGLGVSAWSYAQTQCFAIMHYLRLAAWPQPLVLDYGMYLVKSPLAVAPQALALGLLAAGTAIALWRRPAAGFLGACFFALLAPSSSVVPLITQTRAEHRMYLPLAVVIVAAALALHAATGRRSLAALLALAVGLGGLTARRNQDYRSEFAIWNDTAAKWPDNARVQLRLGILLFKAGRVEEAIARYRRALQAEPHNPDVLNSLGHALLQTGRVPEAIDCYDQVLRFRPDSAEVHNNLGNALARTGRLAEAAAHYAEAIRLKPDYDMPHNNLGIALLQTGRPAEAAAEFETALRLNPDLADAHLNLGNVLMQADRPAEAIAQYEQALRIQPDLVEARGNLGYVLAREGRIGEAIRQFEALVRLEPDNAEARRMLARLRALPPGGT